MLSKSSFRICTQCLRQTARPRSSIIPSTRHLSSKPIVRRNAFTTLRCLKAQVTEMPSQVRGYASKTAADEVIEEITELYSTAVDEFEIASEESEKHSVYAASDRAAAREELAKLLKRYHEIVGNGEGREGSEGREVAEEVKRRIGGRIRELERAVEVLNEKDFED